MKSTALLRKKASSREIWCCSCVCVLSCSTYGTTLTLVERGSTKNWCLLLNTFGLFQIPVTVKLSTRTSLPSSTLLSPRSQTKSGTRPSKNWKAGSWQQLEVYTANKIHSYLSSACTMQNIYLTTHEQCKRCSNFVSAATKDNVQRVQTTCTRRVHPA